ncbi:MAG: glycosyltransferase family 4 protein [Desulfatirhabdiaceae bacterium]
MTDSPPRVLLLVDWVPDKGSLLMKSLRKAGLDCDIMGTDFHLSRWTPLNKILSHWPKCLLVSIRAFQKRHDYDCILAWQQIMGMFLGMIKWITGSSVPNIFILTAIIVERHNPVQEWIRRKFISLSCKRVNHIGFLSNTYKKIIQSRFHWPDSRTVLLKSPIILPEIPEFSGYRPDGYVYSVGRSCRDYKTLFAAARQCRRQFVVVTSREAVSGLSIPDNVTLHFDTFGKDADRLMQNCAAVIIPLNTDNSPAGELTLLEAMCYGKPVIITRTVITREYVIHGENGYLVPKQDSQTLVEAVNDLLSNSEKATKMGLLARKNVLEHHAMDVFTQKISDTIIRDRRSEGKQP